MPLFSEDLERAFRMFATFDTDHNGLISPSELKNALKELGKESSDDEISMLLLSVGAHSRLGMSFSQFIEFYDKQAAISASENPSFEDSLDSFIAMGGRSDGGGKVLYSKIKEFLETSGLKCDELPVYAQQDVSLDFHEFCTLLMSSEGEDHLSTAERLDTARSASRPATNSTGVRDQRAAAKLAAAAGSRPDAGPAAIAGAAAGGGGADAGASEDAGGAPVSLAWLEDLDRKVRRARITRRARLREATPAGGAVSGSNLPPGRARSVDVPARLRGMLAATARPISRTASGGRACSPGPSARSQRLPSDGRRPAWMP